jgi:hypothetical protein
MPETESNSREAAAELRIARVRALSNHDLTGVMTYLLARYPDTFPALLDEALRAVSPKRSG